METLTPPKQLADPNGFIVSPVIATGVSGVEKEN